MKIQIYNSNAYYQRISNFEFNRSYAKDITEIICILPNFAQKNKSGRSHLRFLSQPILEMRYHRNLSHCHYQYTKLSSTA